VVKKEQAPTKPAHPDTAFVRPLTTVDVVIFSVISDALHVLLIERGDEPGEPYPRTWSLPGGIIDVDLDRDLEGCAIRKLKEKTGVKSPYLEQLGSWGDATRDPRGWSSTHAYVALVSSESVVLRKGANAADVRWFPIVDGAVKPRLAFDHAKILQAAIARLRNKVEYTSLPAHLLPEEFTLSDLQRMYEVVLGRRIEKSAFRTRVLSSDLVEAVPRMREGPNRPAQIYRLKNPQRLVFFPRTFNPPRE
jgi:8-oxo-dGTP diphosphatase